jgi:4-amino-4-deoxy-L-arabinose transferase-like glycosyltransferase
VYQFGGGMQTRLNYLVQTNWLLGAIVALGLGLRLWGINFGLPYTYASDEPNYLITTLRILKTGDLNPHWWLYPSLMFYVNAIALLVYFVFGRVAGQFVTLNDLPPPEIVGMGVGRLADPAMFLVTRGTIALFSAAAMVLVYLITRRLHPNKWTALLATLLLAISPTVVDHSHRIGPDIVALFFLLVSAYFAIRIVDEPTTLNYVGAGIGAGLAIGSKYNAGLVLCALITAHCLRFGWTSWRRREIYLAALATIIGFFIATPFFVFDFANFWEGVRWQAFSYSTEGHAGQEGDALRWYVTYLLTTEGGLVLLAVLCATLFLYARSPKRWTLISFPLLYFLFVSQLLIRNARTIMLIIPFLDILAAILLIGAAEWSIRVRRVRPYLAASGALLVFAFIAILPLQMTFAANIRLTQLDGRETARRWLEEHLAPGTRVAVESYSPYLDTKRFVVMGIDAIPDRTPDWYIENGFEYLIFSQGMYGRFFAEPQRYQDMIIRYTDAWTRFPQVARFDDNGFEIRVHKTNATLPSHRVAARFGDYGELIELVGYDTTTPRVQPGESLHVRLFWRALKPANERLELLLHLLSQDDREIAIGRHDLFQRNHTGWVWPEGIFATEWTIPIPLDTEPGLYRLRVGVIRTRFAYTLPARTWAGELIPEVSLGMFKVSVPTPSVAELQVAHTANVRWNDQIELIAYALDSRTARAGDMLNITLYWRSIAKSDKDYTAFVHLLDAQGNVRAQRDAPPRNGAYPTSIWDVGEIVRDDYALELPRDLMLGEYRLVVGLYEYPSLERLSVSNREGTIVQDRWLLERVVIKMK